VLRVYKAGIVWCGSRFLSQYNLPFRYCRYRFTVHKDDLGGSFCSFTSLPVGGTDDLSRVGNQVYALNKVLNFLENIFTFKAHNKYFVIFSLLSLFWKN
jgi:hypothetical protein